MDGTAPGASPLKRVMSLCHVAQLLLHDMCCSMQARGVHGRCRMALLAFLPHFVCCRLLLASENQVGGWCGCGANARLPVLQLSLASHCAQPDRTAAASTQHLCGCSSMIVAALLLGRPLPYYYHCSSCSVSAAADPHASVCVPSCVLPVVLGCLCFCCSLSLAAVQEAECACVRLRKTGSMFCFHSPAQREA